MTVISDLVDALPEPLAEIELRLQLAREAYERGREDGWREGHEAAEHEMAERWDKIAGPIARIDPERTHGDLEVRRWGPDGREHFGDPRPGDRSPAQMIEKARASWAPLGLPPDGLVYISGPAVHWHRPCTSACYAYKPGWYSPERVIEILRTLPGDYRANISELERKAARQERGCAA
jgi:hypothetical protein